MDEDFILDGLNDEEIKYITLNFKTSNYINYLDNIENLPNGFKNDKKKAMKLLHFDGSMLKYLNNTLQDDEEIVLMALNRCSYAIEYASERLKDDYNIGIEISKHGYCFQRLSKRLRGNKEICFNAINVDPHDIQYIDYEVRFFKECLLISLKRLSRSLPFIRKTSADNKRKKKILLCDPGMKNMRDNALLICLPKDLYEEIKNFHKTQKVIKYLEESIEIEKRKIINKFYDIYIY